MKVAKDFFYKIRDKYSNKFSVVTKDILKGSFWVFSGTACSKVLILLSTIIVAHILTQDEYGQLGIIRTTILLFISLSSFGIGTTATKYIAQYKNSDVVQTLKMYLISNIFAMSAAVFVSVLIFAFAPLIANKSLNAPYLINDVRVGAIILFFSLINGAQSSTLSGFEDFKSLAKTNILSGVSQIILLSIGAAFFKVTGAIIGFGLSFGIASVYNMYHISKHIRALNGSLYDTFKMLKLSDFKIIYQFSLPIALTSWIDMPAYWWAKTVLVKQCGFQSMATYDIADQWRSQILFIPGIIAQVILPIFSRAISKNDKKTLRSAMKTNLKLNISISCVLTLCLIILSPFILKMYGPEYKNTIPLILLAVAACFDSVSNICGAYIFSHNKTWEVLGYNATWATSLIVFSYYFMNSGMKENGLAMAYLIAQIFLTILMIRKTKLLMEKNDFKKIA